MVTILVKSFQGVAVESKEIALDDNLKNIADLKELLSESFKIKHFDLIQRGVCLGDERALEGLKEGDVLYALKSPRSLQHVAEAVDEGTMKHVVKSMRQLLSKPHSRTLLETKMKSRDLLECIIEAVPAFGDDLVAIDTLSSTALLLPIFSKKNSKPETFLEKHPTMVHACLIVVEEVKGDVGSKGVVEAASKQDSKALYSLDHMSDNEEMETDEEDEEATSSTNQQADQHSALRNLIRPFGMQMQAATNPASSTTPSSTPSHTITSDFFRQAMRAINSGLPPTVPQATAPATPTVVITEEQVAQMMELGVGDRSTATSLLRQTNANVPAAIAIFYDRTESFENS